ncbi:MAG: peptidoglycan DD-metalloendopeptidase family protein [FCB group bacterium]|nr:peptidoglycan DD-metalloendopeptidase family protein [FCB group bacterium]
MKILSGINRLTYSVMLRSALLTIFLVVLVSFGAAQQLSSKDIQKNIDERNREILELKQDISKVEKRLGKKIREANSTEDILNELNNKIDLTEKLIKSLSREERFVSEQLFIIQSDIEKIRQELTQLRENMKKRIIYLYEYGRPTLPETILLSDNWNEMLYRIKYLDVLIRYEDQLAVDIEAKLSELTAENEKYNQELARKQDLRQAKETENRVLTRDKQKREELKSKLDKETKQLSANLKTKQEMLKQMQELIDKLLADKKSAQKREAELARERELRQMATTGNFAALKGKLPWPVEGTVITHFGVQVNPELKTKTANPGIDIRSSKGQDVTAVLDGIITKITYLHGYGNILIVAHGSGYHSVYAHVDDIIVHEKEYVQAGSQLAVVDGQGILHFEIYGNQTKLNPENWLMRK